MGNLLSNCCEKSDYAEIKDTEIVPKTSPRQVLEADVDASEGSEFASVQKDESHVGPEIYDQTLSVFKGIMLDLKFTSKSSYEQKFVWLNSYSNTIHMSQTTSKEKRHKEASLADVSTSFSITLCILVLNNARLLLSTLIF
jgi:hypothetical protein